MDRRALTLSALLLGGCGTAAPPRDGSAPDDAPAADASATWGAPTCALAAPVSDGTMRAAESLAVAREEVAGCLGRVRSLAYRITVPAGETLTARVAAADGPVVLQVVSDCAAAACLAQSSTSGVAPLRAVWRNDGSAAREVRVLAGSFSNWDGRFSIAFSLAASPTNLRCEDAERLESGAWRGEQPFGPSSNATALCSDREAPAAAGLRWYGVAVPPGQVLAATLAVSPAPAGRDYGAVMVVRDGCATDRCVAATRAIVRTRTTLAAANDTSATQDLRVGVGVYPPLAEGRYSLALRVVPRPAGTRCEAPEALPLDADVEGDTALSPATVNACGTSVSGGPVRFYAVTVPPGRFLELTATERDEQPLLLRARASCDAAACVAEAAATRPESVLRVPNLDATPRSLVVAVGARAADATTAYALRATLASPDPAGRCAGAEVISGNRVLSVDTWRVAEAGPSCGAAPRGPARWYRLTVPANTAARITASPVNAGASSSASWVRVLDACDATACLSAAVSQVAWANTADLPRDVLVAVGAQDADVRGAFNVYVYLQPVAANSRCDRATRVTPASPALRESANTALASGPWCAPGETRYVRYYAVDVPAGEIVHVSALNPFSTYSYGMPELALREGCDAATCAAWAAPTNSRGGHVWWRSPYRTARELTVVAGWASLAGNSYNLAVETFPPAANGRCADAEALALPAQVSTDLARGDATPTPCAPEGRAPVRWYRARLEPGRTLRASCNAPASSFAPQVAVDLVDACDATTCLATNTGVQTGTATWRNDGTAARDIWIAIRAADGAPASAATLSVDAP